MCRIQPALRMAIGIIVVIILNVQKYVYAYEY